jgi:hypothetical protein
MTREQALSRMTVPKHMPSSLSRLVNSRRISTCSVLLRAPEEKSPTCLALWHSRRSVFCLLGSSSSTSLRSLRSIPVTGLLRYYGRSDSCPPGSSALSSMNSGSCYGQVSLIHALDLPIPPSPSTPSPSASLLHATPQLAECPVSGSRLHHLPAGSPDLVSRIEFVILRMDRSPPVAPHPASLRRSYSRLQTGERMSGEDFHLSDQVRFQAHWHGRLAREEPVRKSQSWPGRPCHEDPVSPVSDLAV